MDRNKGTYTHTHTRVPTDMDTGQSPRETSQRQANTTYWWTPSTDRPPGTKTGGIHTHANARVQEATQTHTHTHSRDRPGASAQHKHTVPGTHTFTIFPTQSDSVCKQLSSPQPLNSLPEAHTFPSVRTPLTWARTPHPSARPFPLSSRSAPPAAGLTARFCQDKDRCR